METLVTDRCPTCGSTNTVHGDCLVCNSPLTARQASPVATASRRAVQSVMSVERTVESVVDALSERFSAKTVMRHLDELPPSYLMRTPAAVIGDHIALIERAGGGTAVEHSVRGGIDRLTIATSDRPGVLSTLAGAMAAHGVNITGAAAHTKSGGTAIDVLFVEFSPAARTEGSWTQLCTDLTNALSGDYDVDKAALEGCAKFALPPNAPIPTMVYVDNEASSRFTRVEVNAADRVGLLYAVSRGIASLNIDIHFAHVETVGMAAVDTFYLQQPGGGRIEEATELDRLKLSITEAVHSLDI